MLDCNKYINDPSCTNQVYSLTCKGYQTKMPKIKSDSWVYSAIGQTHTGAMLTSANEDDIREIETLQKKEAEKPVKNVGQLINEYIAFRDELSDLRKTFKTAESIIKESMELIEGELLEIQRKLGLSSTSAGGLTAYQIPKVSIRMGDWDTFSAWLLKTKNFQCVEKRCAKLACLEIQDEFDAWNKANPDETPKLLSDIGLNKQEEIAIQVRRTAGKK